MKHYINTHRDEGIYLGLEYGDAAVRCLAVIEKSPDNNMLVTAYPILKDGIPVPLEIVTVRPNDDKFEAVIQCINQDGVRISFFDPLFCINEGIYEEGAKFEFSIAGFAYSLEYLKDTMITIDEGPMIEIERQRCLEEASTTDVNTINSVDISLEQLRALIIRDNGDDAEFHTAVEEVSYFNFLDTEVCRMLVTFRFDGDHEIKTYIYATEHVLKGYRPKVGDIVRGMLWLQGYPPKQIKDNNSWAKAQEAVHWNAYDMNIIYTDNFLSDMHVGKAVLGRSIAVAGWVILRYENLSKFLDIPTFRADKDDKKVNIYVRSYIKGQEPEIGFPEDQLQGFNKNDPEQNQFAACVLVVCTDIGKGYTIECKGLETLEEITGKLTIPLYIRKPEVAEYVNQPESRIIKTEAGNLELTPLVAEELSGFEKYWPYKLIEYSGQKGSFILPFGQGEHEICGIKLQPTDVPRKGSVKFSHMNRTLIALALPDYLKKNHKGVMVPCVYYKNKDNDMVETGIALFVFPTHRAEQR